jgi:hypothetical protein
MTKQSGLGDAFWIDGIDLSGDVRELGRVGGGPAALDMTGVDKSAMERAGGKRDGGIEWVSFFNKATGRAHPTLSTLPAADRAATYGRGTSLGSPAACCIGKQIDYNPSRDADGNLTLAPSVLANGFGLEWGRQLTAGKRTDTEATDGASYDGGAESEFGAQFYLHVFDFDGDDVTITIQDSADDSSWADLTAASFTQITAAPGSERIETARDATVRRYLRAITTTDAGFTSVTFAVVAVRNEVEVTF